ncbi:hypothetical protein Rsub_02313 [Raphidocelis subcapitata]|uniref:Uncharacterized protein n=1 Tax=Raphidocelis subcapitata TaxID=307507 RepID=A0A2V0NXP2_9CHLO|nr:hypothetical protein Rsub_02313 [Raphidocelis subcapitata]|eukprot:GBF89595.1 hypothetical protein Rsub_02313 [Raphidocelis subcapitata]
MTCPTSSQPGPVATCCEVPGLGVSKCGDTCACDMANGPYCSWGQCCTYTAEAGTGICMTDPLDSAGNQVCSDCNSLNGLACPASKSFCCPDGRCVASADQCATKQCSTSLFATVGGVSKQVCSNCARVGMSCPVGTSYCCKNGKCAAKLEECNCRYTSDCQYGSCCARISGTTVCPNCARAGDNGLSCYGNDWYCAIGQCCGDDGFCRTTIFAGTRQSCANCNNAMANGVVCPTATPVCCARGQCVAKATDCTYNAVGKVYKYQAHHLYYLDSVANASAALDQGLWGSGNPTRPSPNDYYDFRPFVVEGYPDGNGAPTLCSSRWDPATDTYLRGLDYKTAPGTLAWASDLAAQLWFAECNAMPKCKADLATDKVTLARMKLWTKAAADKMISYLQIAPSGRNLLCPPRPYFGFFYQTFVRPYSMASTFYSLPNWASALNPSHIKIKNPAGADEIVSALDMIKRAEDLRYSVPEPLLAMEGLIELLIGYDHTLLSSLPAPILPASAPAAAPASADGAAPAGAVVSMALASTTGTPIEAMDAGPVAPALYAENGFVAGIENPAALKPMAAPQKVEGCVDGDLLCITKSLGLLGASKAAAAQSEGGASQLAADGAQVMAGERGCLSNLRRQQNYLEAAKDFIAYRPAGVWVDPDPAKRAVAIDCPLFEMQFEKGLAVYTFACAAVPDFTAKACKAQQSTLQDFMDTYKAVLATFASVTCDPAATSYKHVNALADGSVFPVIEPGMSTGAQCTKFTYDFNVDRGNYIINYLYERYGKAVTCCASDCESRPECLVLTYYWYSSNYFNIPECGGDSAAVSVNKMPTGLALPPTSGATCGCGDGKGYYGWGVWSA